MCVCVAHMDMLYYCDIFVRHLRDTFICMRVYACNSNTIPPPIYVAVDRFWALLQDRYYDNAAFFRVVPNFVVQFGKYADVRLCAYCTVCTVCTAMEA